jgi:radical SAM superfamily enzyme YgiQ (UPF0313 family)
MVNVLLITPLNVPFKDIKDEPSIKRKLAPKYPVGLLCIGAYLKKDVSEVNVKILDYNTVAPRYFAEPWEGKHLEGLLDYGQHSILQTPDIIGISALFESNYFDMRAITDYLRLRYPRSIIVMGGHLASACYKEFLEKFPSLDAICYGEGEISFTDLVYQFKEDFPFQFLKESPSWITREKIKDKGFFPWNMLVANLDDVPPYDLSMLEYPDDYSNTNDELFGLGNDNAGKDISMFATRGCPYHCIFCASQYIHGHRVRKYSVDRIKHDIMHYNLEYGITSFPFLDDHFLADKAMALEILLFIRARGFTCRIFNLNYLHVNRGIVTALYWTGSDRVVITLDGLNEGFLRKVVRKPADFKKAKHVIQMFREKGIPVISNIIIGFPGETETSIDQGMIDMMEMGANWYSILTATPLHGSELYEICKKKGYLPPGDDIFTIDYYHTVINTPDFTPDWIQKKAYEVNLFLNFVHNYDMSHGDYKTPLMLFERVIEKVEREHALAYYFAAICAKKLKLADKYFTYRGCYHYLCKKQPWAEWVKHFNLEEI